MLGRLEMDVDECISAYSELMRTVFETQSSWLPFNWGFQIKSHFDSAKLESAIKRVITSCSASDSDLFNNKAERGCKV
jgi:hypothetical protein